MFNSYPNDGFKVGYCAEEHQKNKWEKCKLALTTSTSCSLKEDTAFVQEISPSGAEIGIRDEFSENK